MISPAAELSTIFAENAERSFLIDVARDRDYRYREVLEMAVSGVDWLAANGLHRGDRVGLLIPNGVEFATLYLSCLLGGYVAVPLNGSLPQRDRAFILNQSGIRFLLVDSPLGTSIPEYLVTPLDTDTTDSRCLRLVRGGGGRRGFEMLSGIDADAILSINFTSGTTSLPKGVVHRVGSLLGNAASFNRKFGLSGANRFFHVMPMGYMAGFLNTILCPMIAGASVVLAPQFGAASALKFWKLACASGADTFWMSPTMLATLNRIDRGQDGSEYCRTRAIRIFCGTAPLPLAIRREFEEKYSVPVVESYGLSELLLLTANSSAIGGKVRSVGVPLDEVQIRVLNDEGRELPSGSEGDVFVSTPFRSVGYLNYASGDTDVAHDTWFETGDIGLVDQDGFLFITGRKKDLIIRGGFNVSPRAIEDVLVSHPQVENAAVVGKAHSFYGEEIVAVVLVKEGVKLSTIDEALRTLCRNELGDSTVPDRFVAVNEMPQGITGKIQKNVLRSILFGAGE